MCKIHKLIAAIIPLARMREAFVVRQIQRCPRCRESENLNDPRVTDFLNPLWIRQSDDLWPQVWDRICSEERAPQEIEQFGSLSPHFIPRWAWPVAVACFAGLCILAIVSLKHSETVSNQPSAILPMKSLNMQPRVLVLDAELNGKRAKPYIYQTPTGSFIWIVPSKENGD